MSNVIHVDFRRSARENREQRLWDDYCEAHRAYEEWPTEANRAVALERWRVWRDLFADVTGSDRAGSARD